VRFSNTPKEVVAVAGDRTGADCGGLELLTRVCGTIAVCRDA
jgi:hypothetical protein